MGDWQRYQPPVPALRMSVDTHRCSEFQGVRGYFLGHFTDFTVLEIIEKRGGILLTTSVKLSHKGSYPDPHWKGCKISENILVLQKKGGNLSSDLSLFSRKKGVKLLKISLEKGYFSILWTMMGYPFFM